MSAHRVGDRVQHHALPDSTGTVVALLDTPDYGLVPVVAFDDLPEFHEPCGEDEVVPLY